MVDGRSKILFSCRRMAEVQLVPYHMRISPLNLDRDIKLPERQWHNAMVGLSGRMLC